VVSSTVFYQTLIEDRKTINYHWTNDADLIFLNKILKALKLVIVLGLICLRFYSSNVDLLEVAMFLKKIITVILCIFSIECLATLHVIFYRNPITKQTVLQGCLTCAKYVGTSMTGFCAYTDFVTNIPGCAPTPATNLYDQYSPIGRGFGFENLRTKVKFFSLEQLPSFTPEVQQRLLNVNGNMSSRLVDDFIALNKDEIKQNLSIADCQNLGVNKGYFY